MNPLFKVLRVDDKFSIFDEKVGELKWSNGCEWLMTSLGITYELNGVKIPDKGPVVIYSNHPTGLDPYLLNAVIGRDDSYFWGDLYQEKKGNNIAKYIIPIAPKPIWTIFRRPLTNWPGYIYMRLTTPALSKEQTREINTRSIEKTISLLRNRNQVIIFPSGGEYEFLRHGKGLSILLEKCRKQKIPVKVIGLQIRNFSELKLLFHFLFRTKVKAKIIRQ